MRQILLAPILGQWLRSSDQSWRSLEIPQDAPIAHASGPNADRIALIGAGVAVGYGVHLHELALGGQLARLIAERTGRGATVQTYASTGMRALDCLAEVQAIDLTRYDALVLTLGTDEALHLTPLREFRRNLDALFGWITSEGPSTLTVMVVSLPDVTSIMRVPAPLAGAVRRQCAGLNEQLREACAAHPSVRFLPFVPAPGDLTSPERGTYRAWAVLLAPSIARALEAQLEDPRDPPAIDEALRQHSLEQLHILDTGRDLRFDRIVTNARDLFGVAGASLVFIDRERQWSKSSIGLDPMDSPRGGALADATVHNGKTFVVTDARADDRFAGHPWVAGHSKVAFFAGFPIESPNGQRIGALCLVDPSPRRFSDADASLLGDLAQQVEAAIRELPAAR